MARRISYSMFVVLMVLVVGGIGAAAATSSYRVDLTVGSSPFMVGKFLHGRYHGMQSFAFDDRTGDIYAVQVEASDSSGTFAQHGANGDLELTRLSADGNAVLGHMYLKGFGHGVSIGVEPAESSVYLWTECDARPISGGSSRGTKLGRFLYQNGVTVDTSSSSITKYSPILGATGVTPSVDLVQGYLTEKYVSSSGHGRIALFRLADVKAGGTPVPLRDVAMPTGLGTLQGYTTFDHYFYLLIGDPYSATNPLPGNAELYCLDWKSGKIVQRAHTNAFGNQLYREPEGMSVRVDSSSQPKLCFGFSSYVSSADTRKVSSIAYKPVQLLDDLFSGPAISKPISLAIEKPTLQVGAR